MARVRKNISISTEVARLIKLIAKEENRTESSVIENAVMKMAAEKAAIEQ